LLAQNANHLQIAPADPMAALGGLHKQYDLAARLSVQNVPLAMRNHVIKLIELGAAPALEALPGEDEFQAAMRRTMFARSFQQIKDLVKELDEITVGWSIDGQNSSAYLDVDISALPDTKTARQLAASSATGRTNFAGLLHPDAAVAFNWAQTISDDDVAETKKLLATLRTRLYQQFEEMKKTADSAEGLTEEQVQLAKKLLDNLLEVAEKTVENRHLDGGMTLLLKPNAITAVAGGAIVEGAKLEATLKELFAIVQKESPEAVETIQLNAASHQGVNLHRLSVPLPDDDENLRKFLGAKLEIILGIGAESVHVSLGRHAMETLKQVIDRSAAERGKAVPASKLSIAGTPIARFIAAAAEDDQQVKGVAEMVAALLARSAGKDHITMTTMPVSHGARTRLEVEEGVLRAIGAAIRMSMPPVPGGPGMPGVFPGAPPLAP
jgi:hypothetical protein